MPRSNEPKSINERSLPRGAAHEHVAVPKIQGSTAKLLQEASMRKDLSKQLVNFGAPKNRIAVQDPEEVASLAFSLVLACNILQQSGTILPFYKLEKLTQYVIAQLSPNDVMNIEIETFEVLQWLGRSLGDAEEDLEDEEIPDLILKSEREEQDHLQMLKAAIAQERDLIMWYYTLSTGEYSSRRIRPLRVSAEKFLIAYCYKREAERNFRLSRISSIEVVHGENANEQPRTATKALDNHAKERPKANTATDAENAKNTVAEKAETQASANKTQKPELLAKKTREAAEAVQKSLKDLAPRETEISDAPAQQKSPKKETEPKSGAKQGSLF
ncbi:MAG: WYL domain-containing protein [Bradymonadales bacterium]